MKYKELQQKQAEDLKKMHGENLSKLQKLRFGVASRQVKNVREIRQLKKQNARILTIARERELEKTEKPAVKPKEKPASKK